MDGIDMSVFAGAAFKIRAAPRSISHTFTDTACSEPDAGWSDTPQDRPHPAAVKLGARPFPPSTSSSSPPCSAQPSISDEATTRSMSAGSTCLSVTTAHHPPEDAHPHPHHKHATQPQAAAATTTHAISPPPCPALCPVRPVTRRTGRPSAASAMSYPSIPEGVPRQGAAGVVIYSAEVVCPADAGSTGKRSAPAAAAPPQAPPPRAHSNPAGRRTAVDYDAAAVSVADLVEGVPLGRLASASRRSVSGSAGAASSATSSSASSGSASAASGRRSSSSGAPTLALAAYDATDSETESSPCGPSRSISSASSAVPPPHPVSGLGVGGAVQQVALPAVAEEVRRRGSRSTQSRSTAQDRGRAERELHRQAVREQGWVVPKKEKAPLGGRVHAPSVLDTRWGGSEAPLQALSDTVAEEVEGAEQQKPVDPDVVVSRLFPRPGYLERKQKELAALHVDREAMQVKQQRARSSGPSNYDRPLKKKVYDYKGHDDPGECTFRPQLCKHDYTDSTHYSRLRGPVFERLTKPPPEIVNRTRKTPYLAPR